MNRKSLVRGIQIIVVITLATFTYFGYRQYQNDKASIADALAHVKPLWILVGAVAALQEGICGGLRMWVLSRVLSKDLKIRTAITSEFVLMFSAGVTPGQAGAAPSQVAVLVRGGMRVVDVATASLLTAACTITFFLTTAVVMFVLRQTGHLVVPSGFPGVDYLLGLSVGVFGTGLVALLLCAAYPPLLKGIVRALGVPAGYVVKGTLWLVAKLPRLPRVTAWANDQLEKPGELRKRLIASVDEVHEGFVLYLREGKVAYLTAQLLTFGFFCSRFSVPFFILLSLGLPTAPSTFVTVGPPIVQIIVIQALLNFALYLSPTPGASGVAELSSKALMSPWVSGAFVLPYMLIWRVLALFLCMFVGGIYVFRYLGTDVLEEKHDDPKHGPDEHDGKGGKGGEKKAEPEKKTEPEKKADPAT